WLEEAKRVAHDIASKAPIATRLAKDAVDHGYEAPLSLGLDYERRALALAFATEDATEGLTASVEKRKPDVKGSAGLPRRRRGRPRGRAPGPGRPSAP